MNIKDFAEVTLDYFSSMTLTDLQEFIFNGEPPVNNEMVLEWLEWWGENSNSFSDKTLDLVQKQFDADLGAMPIWKRDREFQDNVLSAFKSYFGQNSYFLDFFTSAYLRA